VAAAPGAFHRLFLRAWPETAELRSRSSSSSLLGIALVFEDENEEEPETRISGQTRMQTKR
jgi:hypothetical protein